MDEKKRIGIDFDNTLINYDAVFLGRARALGLVDAGFCGGKDAVRAAVRAGPGGEGAWQQLQGFAYGRGIGAAVIFDGADVFLRRARAGGHEVVIVSHKTQYGHFDPERVDLRAAAVGWMEQNRFFSADGFGIAPGNVRFAPTRNEKIGQIAELACTHFIDDLPEVLDDPSFPPGVAKFLFTNGARVDERRPDAFAHWRELAEAVLR